MAKLPTTWGLILVIAALWTAHAQRPQVPQLDLDECWGDEATKCKGKTTTAIRPFTIEFSQEMIQDLVYRLKNNRAVVPPLQDVGFEYGFNQKQVDPWVKYWTQEYNFTEREIFLNKYPQYKTNIQGLDIHFIWVKPEVSADVTTVPLIMFHGWPSSIRDYYEAIPVLTTPAEGYDFAFEVIVPSLPGYGFSDAAVRTGLSLPQMAVIFKNLMNRLGYEKYYVHGMDWGSPLGSSMATLFPEEVLGYQSNLLMVLNTPCKELETLAGGIMAAQLVDSGVTKRTDQTNLVEELGYMHHQATKPDTLGIALSDSPIGLLAYIFQHWSTFTRLSNRFRVDGGLFSTFSKEQLIDNVMVYWTSNSITTSMRLYSEIFSTKSRALRLDNYPADVPCWSTTAKYDMFNQSPSVLKYPKLLGSTVLEAGHFMAQELPKQFALDVYKAVKAFRNYHATRNEL